MPECVEIRESPIHGLGLFATQRIKRNKKIGKYEGVKYTLREFKEKYGEDTQYCYVARRQNYVISSKDNRNFATYINESKNPNVKMERSHIVAVRDIEEGEELFFLYPPTYKRDYTLE